MIVRIWRGWTRPEDTDAYASYIKRTGIAAYEATRGNRGAYLISRPDGERTEFVTISFWDSRKSIEAFAARTSNKPCFIPKTTSAWSTVRRSRLRRGHGRSRRLAAAALNGPHSPQTRAFLRSAARPALSLPRCCSSQHPPSDTTPDKASLLPKPPSK